MLRVDIEPLENAGPVWPLLKELEAKTFRFGENIQAFPVIGRDGRALLDEEGNEVVEYRDVNETYPRGTQVLVDTEKAMLLYPEGVIEQGGEKYIRMDLLTVLVFQSLKEIYKELSDRLAVLETK